MNTVIIGSGIAGFTCAEALAKAGQAVSLVTRETAGHYSRPMLSHGFSREDVEQRIVMRRFEEMQQQGIRVYRGCDALAINPAGRSLRCQGGDGEFTLDYDTLILAPGSDAFIPPPLQAFRGQFHVLNSLGDLLALRRLRQAVLDSGGQPRWGLIGGGLIGCEMASDLAKAGDAVSVFHMADRLMERQLQPDDSAVLQEHFAQSGIQMHFNCNVAAIETATDERKAVATDSGRHADFDGVIVACGFKPRIQLAQQAGLATQRGISVDGFLRCSTPQVYAVGDAAQCSDGKVYAFIAPIRSQALWLAQHLAGGDQPAWTPPAFHPKAKIHGFTAAHPYAF